MENMILFTLGGASVTMYGMMCTVALAVTLAVMGGYAMLHRATYSHVIICAVPGVLLGWLFSRAVYFLATWFFSPVNPYPSFSAIVNVTDGGYSMAGFGLGLTLGVWGGSRLGKTPRGVMTDALALAMPIGLMIARIAESRTSLGVGLSIDEGWPAFGVLVETQDGLMHAVWAYEAIVAIMLFAVMVFTLLSRKHRPGDGLPTFALLFAATQVVLESLRDDSHMTAHMQIHSQQIICAVVLAVPLVVWAVRIFRKHTLNRWLTIGLIVLALAFVGVAIVAEFGVDRWSSKALAYGLMAGSLVGFCAIAIVFRNFARRDPHGA